MKRSIRIGWAVAGTACFSTLTAQESIQPRPEPTAEQREVLQWVRPLMHCVPEYPESAATSKQEGWVRVEFTISRDGSVLGPHVADSSPDDTFDAVSLDAISKCRFEQRIVNGMPVEIEGAIFDFVFEL